MNRPAGRTNGTASARPVLAPRLLVRLAVRALPVGPVRDRYRREFLAELYEMSTRRQTTHMMAILANAWALRAAVTSQANREAAVATFFAHKPLICRLNLNHRWVTCRAEDGGVYQRCRRCGKDRLGVVGDPHEMWKHTDGEPGPWGVA